MIRELLKKESTFFWGILLIASVLRFWNYWGWTYTHDELGAFIRLNYSSFSEFIAQGVQNNDTHPAFTQVFILVWSKVFGLSELSMRLPFVLAGIGSVALVYCISKKWFGFTTACFSSLTLALLDFPILYSQLARPYSFGLCFTLLAVWCWTRLLFGDNKKLLLKAACYALATALCMLTHYFSFFMAMTVAATGLLFLKKETWKPYLLSGVVAAAVFAPHISVSLEQFKMGGVGGWLAKPESDYLWKFILYGFNESPLILTVLTAVSLISVWIYHSEIKFSKFHAVCLVWFLLPFAAGYYYSVNVNPVLQYSTLLFSFPFLPMFLFSFLRDTDLRMNRWLLGAAGIVLLYSTIIEQRFYKKEHFGVFREINDAVIAFHKKSGEGNVTTVLNSSSREIFDFYFDQRGEKPAFDFLAGDVPGFVASLQKKIDSCTTPYFIYGWSNFRSDYEIPEMIKRKFPCIVYDEQHFNSQVTVYAKQDSCKRDTIFYSYLGFAPIGASGGEAFDTIKIDSSFSYSGKLSLRIDSSDEFCITLKTTVKALFRDHEGCVNVSAWVLARDTFNVQAVMDIGQPNSKNRDWQAKLLHQFVTQKGRWQEVFATFQIPASAYPDDEVSIYLWNPGKNSFYLDDFTVSSFADSRYDYYKQSFRK